VVVDYRKRRNTLLQAGEDRLRECLARDDGISGSAVIPNALKDPACRRSQIDLKQQALVDMRKSTPKPFSSDQT